MMKKRVNRIIAIFIFVLATSLTAQATADEGVTQLKAPSNIGHSEKLPLKVSVNADKKRDIHILLNRVAGNQKIREVTTRVKKTGNYNIKFDPKKRLEPGKYKLTVYLTPIRKGWSDLIGDRQVKTITVLDKAKAPPMAKGKAKDQISKVKWNAVVGDEPNDLEIQFQTKSPRELHIALQKAKGGKYIAQLKYDIKGAGNIKLPIDKMATNFGADKYRWVIYLTEAGAGPKGKALGRRHFEKFEVK